MNTPALPGPSMTPVQVAELLTFISSFDFRTVGKVDVAAWSLLATPGRWTLPYARRAVIEFFTEQDRERLMPGHITKRIRSQREHFASTYHHEPCPAGIVGVDAEVEWERAQVLAHIDTCMDQWAAGGAP